MCLCRPIDGSCHFRHTAKFRAYKVGLAADIEKAFLNIRVKEEQRDLMRFLWVRNLEDEDPEIIVFRFKTVLFGMSCSPFCLNVTLDYHIKHFYKENMVERTPLAERVTGSISSKYGTRN